MENNSVECVEKNPAENSENQGKEVYAATVYYRLLKDMEYVDRKMSENSPLSSDNERSAITNIWNKKVVNSIRKKATVKLSDIKHKITIETENYKQKMRECGIDISAAEDVEKLRGLMDKLFADDKYGINRIFFGIRIALDNEVKTAYSKETLEDVSALIFGDKYKLDDIYDDLKDNYLAIYRKPLSEVSKGVMIGMGLFSLISLAALPFGLAIGASSSAVITSCLAQLGHSAPYVIGTGIVNVTSAAALFSLAILGGAAVGTEIHKKCSEEKLKKNFRTLTVKDLGVIFAIKATIIQHAKKIVGDSEMKEVLDDCLKQINDLRSDAEYMLIVEKINATESKEKISVCNRLTERLAAIVGV